MSYGFLDIAITPSVREVQARLGVDHLWTDFKGHREFDRFGDNEAAFIAERDSFYMATGLSLRAVSWRAARFLKQVDERTLAFADFRGNRQYISTGIGFNRLANRCGSLAAGP